MSLLFCVVLGFAVCAFINLCRGLYTKPKQLSGSKSPLLEADETVPVIDRNEIAIYFQSAKELGDVSSLIDEFMARLPRKTLHRCTASTGGKNNQACDEPATWRIVEAHPLKYYDPSYGDFRAKEPRTLYVCNLHRLSWQNSERGIKCEEEIG